MEMLLFSERSVWTMIHGIGLGGGALMALAAALFFLLATQPAPGGAVAESQARRFAWLTAVIAGLLWLTVLIGTYVSFPAYRASPPEGAIDLSAYPRSLIQSDPRTAWLHSFAMEIKEHVPWIAAMVATAVAFTTARYRSTLLKDRELRGMVTKMLALAFVLVAAAALLGTFINKVAPLE